MTGTEAKILALYDNDSAIVFQDMEPVERAALARLVEHGYMERVVLSKGGRVDFSRRAYRITDAGRVALAAHEEVLEKEIQRRTYEEAYKERDRLKQSRFALFNTWFGSVIGAATTIIINHFAEIIVFIRTLVHK